MRQEVRLLSEKFKVMIFFFSSQGYFINKSSNKSQDNTQFCSNFIPHRLYAKVFVIINSTCVVSLSQKWVIMTWCVQDVKQTHEMQPLLQCNSCLTTTYDIFIFIYFFTDKNKQNKQKESVFFYTPKLKWHIVPNVARNTIPWDE